MRKTKEVLRLRLSWGWGSGRSRAVAGWAGHGPRVSGTGGSGRDRLAVPEGLGDEELEASCLGTNRFGRKRCRSGPNRTGKRFMSNCSNIAI